MASLDVKAVEMETKEKIWSLTLQNEPLVPFSLAAQVSLDDLFEMLLVDHPHRVLENFSVSALLQFLLFSICRPNWDFGEVAYDSTKRILAAAPQLSKAILPEFSNYLSAVGEKVLLPKMSNYMTFDRMRNVGDRALHTSTTSGSNYVFWPWEKPPEGFIKVNIDIGTNSSRTSAIVAGYARDSAGDIFDEQGLYRTLDCPADQSNLCELHGILEAVQYAIKNGWKKVFIETDNLEAARMFAKDARIGKEYEDCHREILKLSGEFEELYISWTPGTVNALAHAYARHKVGKYTPNGFQRRKNQILSNDRAGVPYQVYRMNRKPQNLHWCVT